MNRLFLLLAPLFAVVATAGTLVRFSTGVGDVVVELYDREKPVTVSNFLAYVRSGRYTDMISHRLVPGFVLQGGGFTVTNRGTDAASILDVPALPTIRNEFDTGPRYRNLLGTISMAKIGAYTNVFPDTRLTNAPSAFTNFSGLATNVVIYTNAFPDVAYSDVVTERIVATNGAGATVSWVVVRSTVRYGGGPDSASSQWFLSLADNSSNLDGQNGGFTVFGRVVGPTNALGVYSGFVGFARATNVVFPAGGVFNELPLLSYPVGQPGGPTHRQIYDAMMYVTVTELPALVVPAPDPAGPVIRPAGAPGLTNVLEAANSPGGPWDALDRFAGTGTPVAVPDPAGARTNRFYRLTIPSPLPRPF